MSLPIVFVTQVPHRRGADGSFVPAIDITPAARHGTIRVMLPHQANIVDPMSLVEELTHHLDDYNYARGDSLLLSGDPTIICAASAILREENDKFRVLKWDRDSHAYISMEMDFG